ncbi:MAG: hypothetical protein R2698_03530 [Microthrixaceae bacterium]
MTDTNRRRPLLAPLVALAAVTTLTVGCGNDSVLAGSPTQARTGATANTGTSHGGTSASKEIGLHASMRKLWSDHMQWTFATVDSFFHNDAAVQPELDRLLRNQTDIGQAVVPFYGEQAGEALGTLLTTHIQQAVPVLKAAKANDKAALDAALDDWYANAKEIADLLSKANPKQWPTSATEPMMKAHIEQTTAYATDLLKGDYTSAIHHYDEAYDHMMMLADTLSNGIVSQFPDRFTA